MTKVPPAGLHALRLGLDDWVPVRAVLDVVRRDMPEDQHDALLGTVRTLLEEGLAVLGDLASGPFQPWDVPAHDQLLRLEREWKRERDDALFGMWLRNTAAGDQIARAQGSSSGQ